MKRKIVLVIALVSLSIPSQAQWWRDGLNFLGGLLLGAADNAISNSGNQQMIDNWDNIKGDIAPTSSIGSWGATAGSQLMQGDNTGAVISTLSATAISAGVDEDIVALGNSGVTNLLDGENNAALIDATQLAAHATGEYQFDRLFDSQRQINQINRTRRDNIKKGMPIEEANKIRNQQIAEVTADITEYVLSVAAEKRERAMARKSEVKKALLQRGYTPQEADYLASCLSIEDLEREESSWPSVDEMLDDHHIDIRQTTDMDGFFEDMNLEVPSVDNGSVVPPADKQPVSVPVPKPIVDERGNAVKFISGMVLDSYAFDNTDLSEAQKQDLDNVANKMKQFNDINIVVIGHTCNLGTLKANQNVGTRRAREAKRYLMENGIAENRIMVESRDYSEPVVANDSEEHRKQNRRVTFEIYK